MKTIFLLLLGTIASYSQTTTVWQTRMIQSQIRGATGIPELVAHNGERPSLPIGANGSRFELWGIQLNNGVIVSEKRIDTTEVGVYLPTAEITIDTEDPYTGFYRSRVDQPFKVSYKISNLRHSNPTLPAAASKVLVRHYVDLYTDGSFDGSSIASTVLFRSFELDRNGTHDYSFAVTNLTAPDLIRRAGRERFIVYALADGITPQREIAKAEIIMLPVPEGNIDGLVTTRAYKSMPTFHANLWNSYPTTSTWVEVYDGDYSLKKRGVHLANTGLETSGRIYSAPYDRVEYSTFPTSVQPTVNIKKTIVLRASSPFKNESLDKGGRVLDHQTVTVGNSLIINGMLTTIE